MSPTGLGLGVFRLGLIAALLAAAVPASFESARADTGFRAETGEAQTLRRRAARDPALAAALAELTAEARARGTVRLTVKLAVPSAPNLGLRQSLLRQLDLTAAFLRLRGALPKAKSIAQRKGLALVDMELDQVDLARLQTIPGIAEAGRPQSASWSETAPQPPAGASPSGGAAAAARQVADMRDADPWTNPFNVAIEYLDYGDDDFSQFSYCSGSLIANRFVLTSALCSIIFMEDISVYEVLVGRKLDGSGKRVKVKRIIPHPQYRLYDLSAEYDVALLELATPVTGVPLASLARVAPTTPGTVMRSVGWSTKTGVSVMLQQYEELLVQIVNGTCGGLESVTERFFCTKRPRLGISHPDFGAGVTVAGGPPNQIAGIFSDVESEGSFEENNIRVLDHSLNTSLANDNIRRFILGVLSAGSKTIGFETGTRATRETGDEQPQPAPASSGGPSWRSGPVAGQGRVIIKVMRSSGAGGAWVRYQTSPVAARPLKPGSAASAQLDGSADYVPVTGMLKFAPGQTAATIAVPIINDAAQEDTEDFQLWLSGASPGWVIDSPVTRISIVDDDISPDPAP